jgi:hypothetical protein
MLAVGAQTSFPSGVAVTHLDLSVAADLTLDSGTISTVKMTQDTYNYASNRVRGRRARRGGAHRGGKHDALHLDAFAPLSRPSSPLTGDTTQPCFSSAHEGRDGVAARGETAEPLNPRGTTNRVPR